MSNFFSIEMLLIPLLYQNIDIFRFISHQQKYQYFDLSSGIDSFSYFIWKTVYSVSL